MNQRPTVLASMPNSEFQSADRFQFHGTALTLARVVWVLISLAAVSLLITALVWNTVAWWNLTEASFCGSASRIDALQACMAENRAYLQVFGSYHLVAIYYGVGAIVEILPWILVGALIFWRKSREPFAWFFSLSLMLAGVLVVDIVVRDVIWNHFPVFKPLVRVLYFFAGVLLVLWYRFPNGQFVPRKMRWIAIVWIVLVFLAFILPYSQVDYHSWPTPLPQIIPMIFALSIVFSLLYRYRRVSGPVERQQIKWVVSAGAVYGCLFAPSFLIWNWALNQPVLTVILHITYTPLEYIGSALFAIGIGISILHYRLWDIDIIINRTLVYGALTASVVAIYVIVVGMLGTTIQGRGNLLISILATGLVAVLVQPLRDRLQRGVNRMMYGERDDPVTVLSRLGERLEGTLAPDAVLPSLVETVAQTLKLPYVAIVTALDDHPESSATLAYGQLQSEVIRLPLIYQSETIGQLLVSPRASGEALSPMDRHLLENIAHQAGMAVHAVNLTADLQRSRQRIITAREEERRRLRRDLHDGLGPNLASQGLKLAAAKRLLQEDPASAVPLLDQVLAQNKSTVEDVRHLVYGLRPPALDELGLVAAIRDYVAGTDNDGALQIEITESPGGLPPLSAAVEVAAYRIVLEALTNVIRHAQARHCAIRFSCHQNNANALLQIEIVDDGIGLPSDLRAGVGLRSMRERAEELGGSLTIESRPSITRVLAILPISEMTLHSNLLMATPAENTE